PIQISSPSEIDLLGLIERPFSLTSNTGSKATIRYVPFCLSTSITTPFSGCVAACCKRILTSQSSPTPMRTRSDITTSVDRSLSEDTWIRSEEHTSELQ